MVLAGESSRAANIHAPGAHAGKGVLLSEHVEIPESEGSSELNVASLGVGAGSAETDGCRGLQVAEDRDTSLCIDSGGINGCSVRGATAADAENFNLSHDESIAASVLAHDAVQVGKALEIQNLLWWRLTAHAGVPLVVALDKANNATPAVAEERLLVVRRVVGNEVRL